MSDEQSVMNSDGSKAFAALKTTFLYGIPLAIFLVFKAYSQSPFVGDENIYFYAGYHAARGVTPFAEMPFAHPPLHLLVAALWMLPGSIHPILLKLPSVVPAALTILLSMYIVRRMGVNRFFTFIVGMLGATSYEILSLSTHFTGANTSMFVALLGVWWVTRESKKMSWLGGATLACATLISLHAIPVACAAAGLAFLSAPKSKWRACAGLVLTFVLVHVVGRLAFGPAYTEQLFSYHAGKSAMADGGLSAVTRWAFATYPIWSWSVAGVLMWFVGRVRNVKNPAVAPLVPAGGGIFIGAGLVQLVGVLIQSRIYSYYLAPTLAISFVAAGLAMQAFWTLLREMFEMRRVNFAFVFGLGLVAGCAVWGEKLEAKLDYYSKSFGKTSTYEWRPSPYLPDFVNNVVESCFFPTTRRVGDLDWGLSRYLWHEVVSPDPSKLLPALQARENVKGTLFGDASATPYLALATGRKIAMNMPDTNAQLLKSGAIKIGDIIKNLRKDPPAFIVVNPNAGIPSSRDFQHFLQTDGWKKVASANTTSKGNPLHLYQKTDISSK